MIGGGGSVDALDQLAEVVLHGRHGGDDRRRAEAVRDEREVREMALDGRVEPRRASAGPRRQGTGGGQQRAGTERRLITDQQVHELLHRLPARRTHTYTLVHST